MKIIILGSNGILQYIIPLPKNKKNLKVLTISRSKKVKKY